jgi:hypothetical protein
LYNQFAIKLLAISIIIQAINDLHIKKPKEKHYKRTAHVFFKSKYRFLIASIAGVEDIDLVYKKYKNNEHKKLIKSGRRKEKRNEPVYIL